MKFNDGYWRARQGVSTSYATAAYEVEATASGVTVVLPTTKVQTRGQTLNTPVVTARFWSPAPDVIGVRLSHHGDGAVGEPCFPLSLPDGPGTDGLGTGLQVDHDVNAPRAGHFSQRLGLGHGAWEAVEDETGGCTRPEQVLPDHAHDNVVGHELAPVHVGLEGTPELGPTGSGGAECIARRDVGRPVGGR